MNIRLQKYMALLPLALAAPQAHADDSILVHKAEYGLTRMRLMQEQLRCPALRNILDIHSCSNVSLTGNLQPSAAAKVPQLGNGGRSFMVDASTVQHLGTSDIVWGNASYENGRKYDVVWNETSDYALLYPYIMGDPRGGDMKYEEYRLDGGYSARIKRIHYGVGLGYRALSEYRDRDPRPNNTVADLFAHIGAGYGITRKYVLAVGFDAGKYKQTNELAYFNELGAQKEYHLTGVGNDFPRFSGTSNNTFYKGHNLGGGLSFASANGYGWSASANYMFTQYDKILTDLNRLPLNKLKINRYSASAGFLQKDYGVTISGEYNDRKGNDNLFGDPSGSVYPQIGTKGQYEGTLAYVRAKGYKTIRSGQRLIWNIEPALTYRNFTNRHQDSGNKMDSQDLVFGAEGKMIYVGSKNMFDVTASIFRRQNLSSDATLYNSAEESLAATLQNICRYMEKGETYFTLGAEYTRRVWGNKALSVGFNWRHGAYLSGENYNRYEAKITMTL